MKSLSKSLLVIAAISLSAQVSGKTVKWEFAAADDASQAYVAAHSVEARGGIRAVDFLRNYAQRINLGIDPVTKLEWYPHQSVTINYEVNCSENKLAMRAWKMYDKPNASGETVWVDKDHGLPHFTLARSNEELAVVNAACGETVVESKFKGQTASLLF